MGRSASSSRNESISGWPRRWLRGVAHASFGAWAIVGVCSCGNAVYAYQSSTAESKLEEARELGADKYATYEYTLAVEYLRKADSEAAEADYGDAADFASKSEEHATKAIALSRDAHRGAGR